MPGAGSTQGPPATRKVGGSNHRQGRSNRHSLRAWVLKASDRRGAYWTKGFALADDFENSDSKNVLTFYEAQDAAKRLARAKNGSVDIAPITVDGALKEYKLDLEARNAIPTTPNPRVCI